MTPPADDDFASRLLGWFDQHGRKDLPWQAEPTAYRVWVSEIMLQQTQVATVIPYYQRFMDSFPDVATLAAASLDQVLHHWSGLGYYARARNLHKTAILLEEQFAGRFPEDSEALQALPGIGRSTAGAILSLACGQRLPILDGNVKRVLARYHRVAGWPGKTSVLRELWQLAERYTPRRKVAAYTQAIMDLGATVCTRSKPDCRACPLAEQCQARAYDEQACYPAPRPKRHLPVRAVNMAMLLNQAGEVLLEKRPPSGIWGGLWSLPEFERAEDLADWCEAHGAKARQAVLSPLRHTFSHFHLDITAHVYRAQSPADSVMEAGRTVWYNSLQPQSVGLAAPVAKLLQQLPRETIE